MGGAAGPDMGGDSSSSSSNDDNVVDGDYREV
jgi:molecular chaperone DnaK